LHSPSTSGGSKLWTRAEQLRSLAGYFRTIGVTDQERLKRWAQTSTFKDDFEGRVKGLGPAVYQWLVMRQGVDTVKPDVHVRRFAEGAVGRGLSDWEVVEVTTDAAKRLGIRRSSSTGGSGKPPAAAPCPIRLHPLEHVETGRVRVSFRA
jgi:hypothetical protein